jgi:hypothetical protein
MTDRVAQVVQHLPSKCGTLSSTPGTSGKKKKHWIIEFKL